MHVALFFSVCLILHNAVLLVDALWVCVRCGILHFLLSQIDLPLMNTILCYPTDTFHEVKRKRDKRKEVFTPHPYLTYNVVCMSQVMIIEPYEVCFNLLCGYWLKLWDQHLLVHVSSVVCRWSVLFCFCCYCHGFAKSMAYVTCHFVNEQWVWLIDVCDI